jgi:kinesin family protein 2/24
MDIVRQEMNLLTEVDQPGSAIDQYVERLEVILREKAEGIAMMQRKLEDFKSKLKEEEIMSRTVGSRGRTKARY